MSMEQKVALTKQIAAYQFELSGVGLVGSKFRSIGTLGIREFREEKGAGNVEKVAPGLLVSHTFFMGDHLHYNIARGPFRSSHDWLIAELNIIIVHQTSVLDQTEDEDDREDAEEILLVAQKLLSLVPKVFPPNLDEPEATGLYHHDLHLNNILVNEDGKITAILDWECVSALPLWMFTVVPKFLYGPVREEEPQRDEYADETSDESAVAAEMQNEPEYLVSDGKNKLYYIHRMEYEATQLRKVYKSRLNELWAAYPHEESHTKVEFFEAISQCDGVWVKRAHRWADCMERARCS